MVKITSVERKSRLLVSSPVACLARMPTINLTAGCTHGCAYCYAQGYCSHPGRGSVRLYADVLEKLRDELSRKRKLPAAVSFSPSSDLFQPLPAVLDLAYDALKLLLERGIGVTFLTKGQIPDRHMELIEAHASLVRAQIGLLTLDEKLAKLVEPRAAPPAVRVQQMGRLVAAGIPTQARLDPILPGLTDDPDEFHRLCAAIAEAGVTEIAASMLFLRPAILWGLRRQFRRRPALFRRLRAAFAHAIRLPIRTGRTTVWALPAARRRRTFAWLTAIARQYGIAVRICACKNPDIATGSCDVAGRWSPPVRVERQMALFAN